MTLPQKRAMQYHCDLPFMWSDSITSVEETWDSIAASFDETRRTPWPQCLEFVDSLPKQTRIVDIGCGNGRHLLPAARHCQKAIGVDLSFQLLSIVQQKLKQEHITTVDLVHASATHLPFRNRTIGAVLYIATLHNIKGRDSRIQSLKEVKRILTPSGTALLSVWSRWQDNYRMRFLKRWFTDQGLHEFGDVDIYWRQHGCNIPRFYHLYSKQEFERDLRQAGLAIINIQALKLRSKKHPDNYFATVKNI